MEHNKLDFYIENFRSDQH